MAGLDLLRLLAVVLVLGRHTEVPATVTGWPPAVHSLLILWERGGWVGVDLFFVLSGFLVSGLLFNEFQSRGTISPIRFFTRRGWKIYPPFLALLAATILVQVALGAPVVPSRVAAEVLFVQNYLPGLWAHTWTLAIEEHFYILLPASLLMLLTLRRGAAEPFRPLPYVGAALCASILALRVVNWQLRDAYSYSTHLFPTHLRADALIFGVAISWAYHFRPAAFVRWLRPWRIGLMIAGALLLVPAFLIPLTAHLVNTVGLTAFYLGAGMVLAGTLLCAPPRHRGLLMLARLGSYSYSMYLWHVPMRTWGIASVEYLAGGQLGFAARTAAFFVGSIFVGVVMARLIELPTLRLRDRWFPSRSVGLRAVETTLPPAAEPGPANRAPGDPAALAVTAPPTTPGEVGPV